MCGSPAEQAGESGSRETEARGGLRAGKDWINPAAAQSNTDKPKSVKKSGFSLIFSRWGRKAALMGGKSQINQKIPN